MAPTQLAEVLRHPNLSTTSGLSRNVLQTQAPSKSLPCCHLARGQR